MAKPGDDIRARMAVVESDITRLDVDAIVNAANTGLLPGGGVCGAIHRAAGPELAAECRRIGGCPTGEARITAGHRLKARHVVHAVGPVWRGGGEGEDELLAACYRASLDLAQANGVDSLAFPAISTGIYGYPLERATRIAVEAVAAHLRRNDRPARVVFACFGREAAETYRRTIAELA